MQKLMVNLLKAEAKAFAERESGHKEESLYGVTDGKAVGTYLEHKFQEESKRRQVTFSCPFKPFPVFPWV